MRSKNKGFDKEALLNDFESVMSFVERNFEPPYFARKGRDNTTPRVRFEAISVGIFLALKVNPNLQTDDFAWLESNEFKYLTTSDASNNQGKLRARIEFVRDCLLGTAVDLHYDNE